MVGVELQLKGPSEPSELSPPSIGLGTHCTNPQRGEDYGVGGRRARTEVRGSGNISCSDADVLMCQNHRLYIKDGGSHSDITA